MQIYHASYKQWRFLVSGRLLTSLGLRVLFAYPLHLICFHHIWRIIMLHSSIKDAAISLYCYAWNQDIWSSNTRKQELFGIIKLHTWVCKRYRKVLPTQNQAALGTYQGLNWGCKSDRKKDKSIITRINKSYSEANNENQIYLKKKEIEKERDYLHLASKNVLCVTITQISTNLDLLIWGSVMCLA